MNGTAHVRRADWERDHAALRAIRHEVFIVEQRVPEHLEWEDADATAVHLLAEDAAGRPVGCARLLPDGRIGRMAVLATHRGRGIGARLLETALAEAADLGLREARLAAQVHAIGFYQRFGFEAEGETFMEAGIPHRHMRRAL